MLNPATKKKIYAYLVERLNLVNYRRGWMKGVCPYCSKLKLGVHLDKNRVHCFVCGELGNTQKFIMELENLSTLAELHILLNSFKNSEYLDYEALSFEPVVKKEYKTLELPKSYKNIILGDSQVAKSARTWMKSRGFNLNNLALAGVGYCDEGEYFGRVIIPYYYRGQIVYFNARKIFEYDGEKFKNPKVEEVSIGKANVVYNMDALALYDKVWAVESATNALTIGPSATGFGGKDLSPNQISAILRSPVERVVIGLDDDALKQAYKLALTLCEFKKVKVLHLPPAKDINAIGKKASKELEKSTSYGDYKFFKKMLYNYK